MKTVGFSVSGGESVLQFLGYWKKDSQKLFSYDDNFSFHNITEKRDKPELLK